MFVLQAAPVHVYTRMCKRDKDGECIQYCLFEHNSVVLLIFHGLT